MTARHLLSGTTVSWSEINTWIKQNGNPDLSGAGYAGNSLSGGSSNCYADIRQEQSGGKVIVSASIVFNAKQGAALHKTWSGTKLDSQLQTRFGDNLRFRMKL